MKRNIILGFGAFSVGALAGGLYLRGEAEKIRGGAERRVVQLVRTLERQAILASGDWKVVSVPERYADPRAISVEETKELVGKRAKSALPAGAILVRDDAERFGDVRSVVKHIEPGFRAYLLRAEQVVGAEDVRTGDRVDLALVPRERSEKSELLLENVEVLVGGFDAAEEKAPRSKVGSLAITVRPEEALRLMAAESRGKFRLLPRSLDDHGVGAIAAYGTRIRTYAGAEREAR